MTRHGRVRHGGYQPMAVNAKLVRIGSHSVSESLYARSKSIDREEVFLYYAAMWRGLPVTVTMLADRYGPDISHWRVYARDVLPVVSSTARQRLSAQCQPLVIEWLASDAYIASERVAYAGMIANTLRDNTREARRQVSQWNHKLSNGITAKLNACADAHDEYMKRYSNVRAAIDELLTELRDDA